MQATITNPDRTLQYYVIARKWLSDLEFFKIETAYLHRLMDDYIVRLQDADHIHRLIEVGKELKKLEQMEINNMLANQITQLELMAEDVIPEDSESLAATQVQLEYFITNLNHQFRKVKQELFRLVLDVKHKYKIIAN
ncbi:hypothetical protein [Mucilaginibacter sp.]|uniref:hypothetical protein n=1 Tax=Mucilaginibacter sp. TaxID=1882438 RepID=UPI0025E161EC|nr:hypothetical protein [Mucilaginibacter sp.]